MESIKFYKLVSPYPEDVTMNCKLTTGDIDDNFLAFKDNDISAATFDCENMVIDIIRNNGDKISVDISCVRDEFDEKLEEVVSGLTPQSIEIDLNGTLSDDGILTLNWTDTSGEHSTSISGFLCEDSPSGSVHDSTLHGAGTECNPLGISNVEKTGYYKAVNKLIPKDDLPHKENGSTSQHKSSDSSDETEIGYRVVHYEPFSMFGRLYSKDGLEAVKEALARELSAWRVPTQEDWDKLLTYADVCDDVISGDSVSIEDAQGEVCGKMLKSVNFWQGNENLDLYGFFATPSGYISASSANGISTMCAFWTDTEYEPGHNFIKGFTSYSDGVFQFFDTGDVWCSIRLVRDICGDYVSDSENILGNTYKVINFPELKQAWIAINLNFNSNSLSVSGESNCVLIDYDGNNDSSESGDDVINNRGLSDNDEVPITLYKCILSHWNGQYWESKQLNNGDKFNLIYTDGSDPSYRDTSDYYRIIECTCIEDEFGNQEIIFGTYYDWVEDVKRTVIDAGEY